MDPYTRIVFQTPALSKREMSGLFLPEFAHVFEGFAFGFRDHLPDEDGGDDTDHAVDCVGSEVAEGDAHRTDAHVVQRHEGGGNDEVEDPLESDGDRCCLASDSVREDLGNENPADRSPAEHECGAVDKDTYYRNNRRTSCDDIAECHAERSDSHQGRTPDKQRLAPELLDSEYCKKGERNIDDAHEYGVHHRVAHAHRLENTRRKV